MKLSLILAMIVVLAGCAVGEEPAETLPGEDVGGGTATTVPAATSQPATSQPTTSSVEANPATTLVPPPGPGYPMPADGAVDQWVVEVVEVRPHDATAFTQGLLLDGEVMYESTGLYGESTVRRVDPMSGAVLAQTGLDADLFGEGLELVDDRLIQITWQEEVAIVWDTDDLTEVGRLSYEGEGWGLCDDGDRLVMSDGTAQLTFRDRETFEAVGRVEVVLDGTPVELLNELECVDGLVFANVWKTDMIVVIEPTTGSVTAVVDASPLRGERDDPSAVLNGIAHDPATGSFLVTGKLWSELYEVRFVDG